MPARAIRVENLSKMYRIGSRRASYKTLRETMVQALFSPAQRIKQVLMGQASSASGLTEEFWALNNISFDVQEGEVLGIIGRNGAGKSTLLKLLSRITEPTRGHAEIHGRVGSLLEVGTGFHPELTGRENIYLNGAILGMRRVEIDQKFDEIVDFAEVEQFIDTPVKHYSSGMRLRLGFAVAAHLEPDILIVDEVLAVGDAAFQKKCLGKMGDVAGSGRTVLFVSHNMAALKSLCDKGLVLNKGEIIYHGGAIDAVSHYLDLGSISSTKRSWEPQNAPAFKSARLLEVELLSDGEISSNGDVSSEKIMRFAITYEVMQEAKVGTSALLYNADNVLVFASLSNHEPIWHLKNRPKGLYQSICEVPANLLNDGFYSLTVILWEGFYEGGITESDVLQFYVHEQGFVRGDYPSKIKGLILPKLEWISKAL